LRQGDVKEAMRLADKALDDPAKDKFAAKLFKYAADRRYSGKYPSGISLVSSTGEILHTKQISGEVIGNEDRAATEINFRIGYGMALSKQTNILGFGTGIDFSLDKTLYSYQYNDREGSKHGGIVNGADSPFKFEFGLQKGPFEGKFTSEFDSEGISKKEISGSLGIFNGDYDKITGKTSGGYKLLGLSYGSTPIQFELDLKINDAGYKPYRDPTKVSQDATKFIIKRPLLNGKNR